MPESLKWSIEETDGKVPQARDGHSACVVHGKMYIFGGYEAQVKYISYYASIVQNSLRSLVFEKNYV